MIGVRNFSTCVFVAAALCFAPRVTAGIIDPCLSTVAVSPPNTQHNLIGCPVGDTDSFIEQGFSITITLLGVVYGEPIPGIYATDVWLIGGGRRDSALRRIGIEQCGWILGRERCHDDVGGDHRSRGMRPKYFRRSPGIHHPGSHVSSGVPWSICPAHHVSEPRSERRSASRFLRPGHTCGGVSASGPSTRVPISMATASSISRTSRGLQSTTAMGVSNFVR